MPVNTIRAVDLTINYCLNTFLMRNYRPINGARRGVNGTLIVPPTPTLARYIRAVRESNRLSELIREAHDAKIDLPHQLLFPRAWSRRTAP